MDIVTVLGVVVGLISSSFLTYQAIRYARFDSKKTKSFEITNKKTGKSTTLPAKPSRAELKRFIDLVEH